MKTAAPIVLDGAGKVMKEGSKLAVRAAVSAAASKKDGAKRGSEGGRDRRASGTTVRRIRRIRRRREGCSGDWVCERNNNPSSGEAETARRHRGSVGKDEETRTSGAKKRSV